VGQNDFGQLSLCSGFLLGVGLWGAEGIVAPGEMDLRAPVGTRSLSGSQLQTPTAVGLCWVLAGQKKEDEDGCLKSESLQCRGRLFSVLPSVLQGAPLLTGFCMKTSLLPRDWEATADGSSSRGWREPRETACSQKLGRHGGMMLQSRPTAEPEQEASLARGRVPPSASVRGRGPPKTDVFAYTSYPDCTWKVQ